MIPVAAQQGCPLVIAHRGGGGEAPENSMAAVQRLDELGVHHLETDAHVSADGVVVLSHDPVVDRTYDGSGAIIDMTWREISQLRNAAGERMPTLAEVLEAHPTAWFNIDAKSDEVVDTIIAELAAGASPYADPRLPGEMRRAHDALRAGRAAELLRSGGADAAEAPGRRPRGRM